MPGQSRFNFPLKNSGSQKILFTTLLFFILILVYKPALDRFSLNDGDQLWYFYELKGDYTFHNAIRQYDYSLSRVTNAGDHMLFRPLLFIWMAVLTHLFTYYSIYYNYINLALHALAALAVFRLLTLTRIHAGIAGLLSLSFALATMNWYLVTNIHLSGYLLAFFLFLMGLCQAEKIIRQDSNRAEETKSWILYTGLMLAACFLYEVMAAFSFLTGLYILWNLKREGEKRTNLKLLSAIFIPCLIYGVFYALRAPRTGRLWYIDRADIQAQSVISCDNLKQLIPCAVNTLTSNARRFIAFDSFPLKGFRWIFPSILIASAILFKSGFHRKHIQNNLPRLSLYTSFILIYAAALCFVRGADYQSYHRYFFALIPFLLIPCLVDFSSLSKNAWYSALLVLSICLIAHGTLTFERNLHSFDSGSYQYFDQLAKFVDRNKNEKDFSFKITAPSEDYDGWYFFQEGFPDKTPDAGQKKRISGVIFTRYQEDENPKHRIAWSEQKQVFEEIAA